MLFARIGCSKKAKKDLYFMEHFDFVFKILKTWDIYMVQKRVFLAVLGHPMWPKNIVAGHNFQAEKNGTTFAS